MATKISLPKKLYDELVRHERAMGDMISEFDKAEACDIDCTAMRDYVKQQLDAIASLKQNYGPRAS